MATPVAYGWAGAVFKSLENLGRSSEAKECILSFLTPLKHLRMPTESRKDAVTMREVVRAIIWNNVFFF